MLFLRNGAFTALAFIMVAAPAPLLAVDKARDYNVVVSGNFISSGSDVEGRVAAGGNINVGSYSNADKNSAGPGRYAAVAGGTFTGNYGSVYGDTLATSYSGPFSWVGGTAKTYSGGNTSPIDIASEMTRLSQLSTDLAANPGKYGTVGTSQVQYNQLFLVGGDDKLNIFNISAQDWADTKYGWHLATKAGSLTVINISGLSSSIANSGSDNGTFNGGPVGFAPQGYDSSRVIYNFFQANSVTSVGSVNATILAPTADFYNTYGVIQGQLFAKSYLGPDGLAGHIQVNHRPFQSFIDGTNLLDQAINTPSDTPEPATWAMFIAGFGLVGGAVRRRRTFAVAA